MNSLDHWDKNVRPYLMVIDIHAQAAQREIIAATDTVKMLADRPTFLTHAEAHLEELEEQLASLLVQVQAARGLYLSKPQAA